MRLHREAVAALDAARQSEQRYARAARHDDLTGLPNRRLFGELLQRSMARGAARAGAALRRALHRPRRLQAGQRQPRPPRRRPVPGRHLRRASRRSCARATCCRASAATSSRCSSRTSRRPTRCASSPSGSSARWAIRSGCRDASSTRRPASASCSAARSTDGGRPAARRRHRDVSRQGGRPRRLPDLRPAHARLGGRAPDARDRAAPGGRAPRVHARLSADRRAAVVGDQRPRGVRALDAARRPRDRPADFIPVAEETGLIVPLTYSVLGDACRQAAAWQRMFGQPLGISVNISSRLFARSDFVDEVERARRGQRPAAGHAAPRDHREHAAQHRRTSCTQNFERLRRHAACRCTSTTSAPATRR